MYFLIFVLPIAAFCTASDTSLQSDDCATFDLCRTGDELFRTCSCDSECRDHASCCRDSNYAHEMAPPNSTEFKCQSDRTLTPVYAKRACSKDFVLRSRHKWECEEAESDKADVLGNVLVTSVKTGTTYWNRACAVCNNEDRNDLRLWTIQVTCPSKHEDKKFNQNYIEQNLHFDRDLEEWGLKVKDGFKVCTITYAQPGRMVGKLSYCAPNLVSGCPTDFSDRGVVEKCLTYHAERRQRGTENKYFRNTHCAQCNGVNEEELECVGRSYGPVGKVRGRDQVQVSFDQEWLHRVGPEKYRCSMNNSWDPFTERCRKLPEDLWKEITEMSTSTSHAPATTFHYCIFVSVIAVVSFNKITFK